MPSILPSEPPAQDAEDRLIITSPCLKCGLPLPIGASMDDAGNILDVDTDFADLYAHVWTHEVSV